MIYRYFKEKFIVIFYKKETLNKNPADEEEI